MKINEFASAEDTLALWKMISDNTWAAMAQQAEAEAKQKAERAAARKSSSKRGAGGGTAKPAPPKRLPPPLQHVSAPMSKAYEKNPSANKPQTHNAQPPSAQQAQPTAKPELSTAPAALPTQQKAVGMAQQQPNATTPQTAHLQQPHATQQPLTPQQMRLQRQNVGYLAKNSAATKKM